jgi:hypothetical protein
MTREEIIRQCAEIARTHRPKKVSLAGYELEERELIRAEWNGEEIAGYLINKEILGLLNENDEPLEELSKYKKELSTYKTGFYKLMQYVQEMQHDDRISRDQTLHEALQYIRNFYNYNSGPGQYV